VALAQLSKLTGNPADCIWYSIYPFLVFLTGYSLFGFAWYLFRKPPYAAIYLLAHIWVMNRFGGSLVGWKALPYPYMLNPLIIMPLAWVFYFEFLRHGKKSSCIMTILLCILMLFIHKLTFLGFLIFLSISGIVTVIVRGTDFSKRLRPMIIPGILGILLIIIVPLLRLPPTSNPFTLILGAREVLPLSNWGVIAKPDVFLYRAGWVVFHERETWIPFLSLMVIPLLLWRAGRMRKNKACNPLYIYCVSGFMIIPLIMINPIMGKIFSDKFTKQALMRLYSFIPHFSIVLAGAITLNQILIKHFKSERTRIYFKTSPYWLLIFVAWVFLYKNVPSYSETLTNPSLYEDWRKNSAMSRVLQYLEQNTKEPGVVCANCFSEQYVPALTKHYLVQVFPHITSHSMRDYTERTNARDIILGSKSSAREKSFYIRKYRVKYILLDYNLYGEYTPAEFESNFRIDGMNVKREINFDQAYLYSISETD
jgi:hypothetical protein